MKKQFYFAFLFFFFLARNSEAALVVTTATGGTSISADKAANATSPAWTTLGSIILEETNNADFPSSLTTFSINAPNGWEFNTSGVTTTVTGATGFQNVSIGTITYSATSISFSVTVSGTNKHDKLTISGIQVRSTNGAAIPNSGNITWGGAWLDPLWTGYPLGTLSQESGLVASFSVEAEWGGNIGTQNAIIPFNIRITAKDQFNNTCSSGSNVFTGAANITSTGTLSAGTTTSNFTAGVITHSVTISNGGNFTLTATSGSATGISNTFLVNNPPPTVSLSIDNTTIPENGGTATVTITLSNTYYQPVGVGLTPTGTAGGGDFSLSSYYVTIPAGSLTGTSIITAIDDTEIDIDETVIVSITSVNNGTENGVQEVTTTIIDDENPPPTVTLSIDKTTIAENGGIATVTITLSNTFAQTVGVNLDPSGGTAGGGDYSFTPYYVGITAGNLTATATITGVDDAASDPGETVVVSITSVSNGTEDGVQQVTTTIIDDDTPGITVAPTSGLTTTEDGGTDVFSIVLNTQPTDDVTITLYSDDTGEGNISPSSVTFTDINWDTPQTITITGVADYIVDGNISYNIITNTVSSADTDYNGLNPDDVSATNIDNGLEPLVTFNIASQSSINETGSLTITVDLNFPLGVDVSIPFSINAISTATNPSDYNISTSPVVIPAGNTTTAITLTIAEDAIDEINETVVIEMGTPTNAEQGSITTHTATITDDDPLPSVSFTNTSQASINESGSITVTVELSSLSAFDVNIPFVINASSTATTDIDYTISSSPIVITAGSSSADITISITTDTDIEGDESVIINMETPTNASQGSITTHTATITDDDFPPQVISSSSASICEGDQITLSATLSGTVNCSDIVRYEESSDGGSNWVTIIASPGTTCNEIYTPSTNGIFLYRFYFYKNAPNSGYSNSISVTVNELPVVPTAISDRNNICSDDGGNISLSVTGGSGTTVRWFTGSCGGTDIGTGNPLVITSPPSSTTYYARYENGCGTSTCSPVTVTVYATPSITNPGDQSACGTYSLPAINGTNLTGGELYYTGTGGTGTSYSPGTSISSTQTPIYIYDNNSGCSNEESFNITINKLNIIVSDISAEIGSDCPDLFSPFDPNNSSYNAGVSEVSYRVVRDLSFNNWTFDFSVSGGNVSVYNAPALTGDDITNPSQTSGTFQSGSINAGNNSYVDFTFEIVNVPGSSLDVQFSVSNGNDGSCNETESTSDNTITHTIEAMPAVGSFN